MKRSFQCFLGVGVTLLVSMVPLAAQSVKVASNGAVTNLLQRLASAYVARSPGINVEVIPGLGSAGAIAAVGAGAIDLAVSGRDLNEKEAAQGFTAQRWIETPFVFVSASPAPLSLTSAEILEYYAGKTTTYPDGEPIRLILRPRGDANTLFLLKEVPGMVAAMTEARQRQELPVAGSDQDNMLHLKSIHGAFSCMSLVQLSTEPHSLQRVRLNGVDASLEAMASGSYPLKMVMLSVTSKTPSEATRAFLAYLGSQEARGILEAAGARLIAP